ncbi:DNA/RNA helicase domain-containing protein [Neorhodopirellula lusitana]|uniref:DNA/RNA helicase domain-containing protein n=1 Tax=Neorhodopirellula lusitana TaxID=445327 RepID=UPI00384AD7E0
MIVYAETKGQFVEHVKSNEIDTQILKSFEEKLGHSTGQSEIRSWRSSLMYMSQAVDVEEIPDDAGVAIEYRIPQTSKRIDFVISGFDINESPAAVVVELKQWSDIGITEKDAVVEADINGWREMLHPSYQAWSYTQLLRDFNETVYSNGFGLFPCAYLHNCTDGTAVQSEFYGEYLQQSPVFLRSDRAKLTSFIARHVRKGDQGKVIYDIEHGKIRPSKDLANHLSSLLSGNREFTMIDDQKLVYETVLSLSKKATKDSKHAVVVRGGPGTGKSVVAINLLVELTNRGLVAQYVTRNSAPRTVYESKLAGSMRKSRISSLFKGSGSFTSTDKGEIDVLIVDEAHRLNAKSGMFQNMGENQVKELIWSSNVSVFFVDEDQAVTLKDIGTEDEMDKQAAACGATVTKHELKSQFRCNGSDGYLSWLNHALQIRETANTSLEGIDYDFRVCDNPKELRSLIADKNEPGNRSRLVAGYCWPWTSKKDSTASDIVFPKHGFSMQWNLTDDGFLWLVKPESVDQVGCIHTCQGLELEYVGVIIGPDFVIRDGVAVTDATERASQDRSVHGYKKLYKEDPESATALADRIIKNTYRVLMTRGQKGCFVWSVDPETNFWLQESI